MVITTITESVVEEAAIDWFKGLSYQCLPSPDIACDGTKAGLICSIERFVEKAL
jgi:hypothetical protein